MSSTENNYQDTDLGNITFNPRGEYNSEETYEYLDTVSYMGGSYMCLAELAKTISGIAPAQGENTDYWQMLTLPGQLTPEAVAMHDDVVNKAKQVETSRATVELSQQEIEAAQADVNQMRQDTQESAEEAASSRDSAAGYAQSAETSRTAAKESEDNINAQMTGFDTHVAKKISEAESAITEARRAAVSAVSTKQDDATQAVTDEGDKQIKKVEDAGTEQVGKAKSAGASAVSAAGAAGMSAVNAVKAQQTASIKAVADEGTQQVTAVNTAGSTQVSTIETKGADRVKAIQEAGKNALQNISNGVDKGLSEEGKAADAKATGEAISKLTEDLSDLSESVNGIELSKNLLDNSSVIENKRPSNWAGQTINDSYKTDGYYTFRAIPVTQNSTYYFVENGDLVNFGQLATYDKDGKYVSLLNPSTFNVNRVKVGYIIPENIAYVRGESNTSNFSNVNFKLFNGRFEKKFLKYNESAYDGKNLPVIVFDFDQVVEIDARFTILKKYGFAGNVVETATNNYEITKELIKMGYDISPYLGNHTWDYSTEDGIQKLTANIAEKLGGLEAVGIYNPTMISCSGHKYSDTMEKILSSYKIDYVRCSGFIKDGVSKGKTMYENSYGTRIVVPIGLGSYNGVDEFNATIDSLVDGNVPLIMPFMHTFGYDADWITQEAFEKVVSHVSELVKNGKALCMNMHDFVAYNDAVKSIHDDYIRNMSAIFN